MNKQTWILKNRQKGNTSDVVANDVHKLVNESTGIQSIVAGTGISVNATDPFNPIINSSISFLGTNHILLIMDGTPAENGLKIRNFFNALPNDKTPFSIMTLGGEIDQLPNLSSRPFTSIGSLDKANKLVVNDVSNLTGNIVSINFQNVSIFGAITVTNSFRNNTISDSNFGAITVDSFNNNTISDSKLGAISVDSFNNNTISDSKLGNISVTVDNSNNLLWNIKAPNFTTLPTSRLVNCLDGTNVLINQ